MRATRGLQTPQQITTASVSISPLLVRIRPTRPRSTSMPSTSLFAETVRAPDSWAGLAHQRPRAQRIDHAHALRVEATDDHGLVDVGHELLDLGGRHQRDPLDPPRCGGGHPAGQLLHALLGSGDLDPAADREHAEPRVLVDAVAREGGHLTRVVHRVDEVRGVPGRAARVRQRPLVEQHEVAPPESAEVVRDAVADDAGADHDRAGRRREGAGSRGLGRQKISSGLAARPAT